MKVAEPVSFEVGGAWVRRVTLQPGAEEMSITRAAQVARDSEELENPDESAADQLLRGISELPQDERPVLPLVLITGHNGHSTVKVATCRCRKPTFRPASDYRAGEFFLLVRASERPS